MQIFVFLKDLICVLLTLNGHAPTHSLESNQNHMKDPPKNKPITYFNSPLTIYTIICFICVVNTVSALLQNLMFTISLTSILVGTANQHKANINGAPRLAVLQKQVNSEWRSLAPMYSGFPSCIFSRLFYICATKKIFSPGKFHEVNCTHKHHLALFNLKSFN